MTALRLATRRSPLGHGPVPPGRRGVTAATGRPVELVEVVSQGDRTDAPLTQIGGVGVFVVAVRQAVLDGIADLAVHSLKDLPTAPAEGLTGRGPAREDVRDALVGPHWPTWRPRHAWGPDLPAGQLNWGAAARTSRSSTSAAMSTVASPGPTRVMSTPSSWPWLDSVGWVGPTG